MTYFEPVRTTCLRKEGYQITRTKPARGTETLLCNLLCSLWYFQKRPKYVPALFFFLLFFFFHLTYSRWTSSLPSCLWSQRIFPSLPGSRLTIFYRDASSALLQLVNQWLNFTYSRYHAFRYERKNTNPTLVRIELATSVLADVQLTY